MQHQWVILKFGGSSVADPRHWQTISSITRARMEAGYRPLLVLSALKNVSNALEALLHQALAGVHSMAIGQLKELHLGFASRLGLDANELLAPRFRELSELCQKINRDGEISPPIHAQVLSIGELLSTTIGVNYLATQGFSVDWLDARQMLTSHNRVDLWHHYTSAQCDFHHDPQLIKQLEQKAQVVVTQGFIASDENGNCVLLGREGSDTSAAYFGAKLQAAQIEIWTDVPGVFSANPREIPAARLLPSLTYQQAQHMASLGAKVLHPRAVAPAEHYQIPLWVKSTSLPALAGTQISPTPSVIQLAASSTIALAVEPKVTWLRISNDVEPTTHLAKLAALCSEGFDQIANFTDHAAQHYIISYKNSDRPQPSDVSLQRKYSLETDSLVSRRTLISLFGERDHKVKTSWVAEINAVLKGLNLPACEIFGDESQNLLSVLVDATDQLAVSRALHHEFIEKNPNSGRFGPGWLSFQD